MSRENHLRPALQAKKLCTECMAQKILEMPEDSDEEEDDGSDAPLDDSSEGKGMPEEPCKLSTKLHRLQTRRRLHAGHFCKKARQQRAHCAQWHDKAHMRSRAVLLRSSPSPGRGGLHAWLRQAPIATQ